MPVLLFFVIMSFGVRTHAASSSAVLSAPRLASGFFASVWQLLHAGLAPSITALPARGIGGRRAIRR